MRHTQYCTNHQCNPYCRLLKANWIEYQSSVFKDFDFGEMALRQAIGIRQETKGIVLEIMKDKFRPIVGHRSRTTDTILEAIRDKYPRIRFNDTELTFLKRAYDLRHTRHYYPKKHKKDFKRELWELRNVISRRVLPAGKRAYTIRSVDKLDKDYSFGFNIIESKGMKKEFLVDVMLPRNFIPMFYNRRPFLCVRPTPQFEQGYAIDHNTLGFPIDLHLNPNPTGWVPVTVFAEVSPRRVGYKKIFVTRYKNIPTHVAHRDVSVLRWPKPGVFENDNPFVFSETEIPLA